MKCAGAQVFASKIECFRCNAAKGSKGTAVKLEGGERGRARVKYDPEEPLLPKLAERKVNQNYPLSLSLSLSLTHTHTLSLSLTQSLSHTHNTQTFSLSCSISPFSD